MHEPKGVDSSHRHREQQLRRPQDVIVLQLCPVSYLWTRLLTIRYLCWVFLYQWFTHRSNHMSVFNQLILAEQYELKTSANMENMGIMQCLTFKVSF